MKNKCWKLAFGVMAMSTVGLSAANTGFDAQGHRGARGLAPENTLAAFSRALSIGVTTLELDVGISRDGAVVITHNPRLNRHITRVLILLASLVLVGPIYGETISSEGVTYVGEVQNGQPHGQGTLTWSSGAD
jgi:glycerophosphoryl diester phosphodiesterase